MSEYKYVSDDNLLYFWQKIKLLLADKADTSDLFSGSYTDLNNKPSINGVELGTANTLAALGIQPAGSYPTEAEVEALIQNVVGAAPTTLDTLKELADALGNDANFATTITTALSNKVNAADLVALTNTEIDTIVASQKVTL